MTDKRQRSRVQGGWAGAAHSCPPTATVGSVKASQALRQSATNGSSALVHPAFQPDQCQLPPVSTTKVIDTAGSCDISTGPSGLSTVQLVPGFIDAAECNAICSRLIDELPWQQETVFEGGETYLQPRMTAWFGEYPYSYNGITHRPNNEWPALVRQLKERIELNTGLRLNSLLANLYRDGHDHVSWHCDDEPSLGRQPTIASLSFGDTRNFELRKKPPPELRDTPDYVYTEFVRIPLDSGSLLVMGGAVQDDWQHRIPKEYHDRSARVNLTFRFNYPEDDATAAS